MAAETALMFGHFLSEIYAISDRKRTASLRLFGAKHYIPHNFPHQMNWLSICAEIKALFSTMQNMYPIVDNSIEE